MAIQGAKPDHGRVTPHLLVRNAAEAVEFYKRALGAEVLYMAPLPNGQHLHAHLRQPCRSARPSGATATAG